MSAILFRCAIGKRPPTVLFYSFSDSALGRTSQPKTRWNYRFGCRDGREKGWPFDVAIMDLTVPSGMGGREAMRGLLAIDPEAKAVVSSGYSQDPVVANFRDYGFRDVLAKPYRVLDVSRVLSGLVGKGRTPTD